MNGIQLMLVAALSCLLVGGFACEQPPKPYGTEASLFMPGRNQQVWAVAPAVNLSGERVDPLLQADIVFGQLQQIRGLTVIPVNRVVEVYEGLGLEKVQSPEQAAIVCDVLGCDGLIVPTVTAYDPYDPPKVGAALQLFRKPRGYKRPENVDVRELARAAAPRPQAPPPVDGGVVQAVGMFDAANGTVRRAVMEYAQGRHDPVAPMGARAYFLDMDRYSGFVYTCLAADLLRSLGSGRS